ncbi:uncharacterized protein EMH_0044480 [Eimeria mitis]|uniref:Uncharacterized protein n=1 Tax=Eimeria mitis TaxID=44415 RepID=U6JVS7_9EIME|nr:uncharacterized protein EMH_0044480 [Eimeria mitis]CDJ28846.1 hypothetical protein EMH_0044480 [Eimeria mitis]
MFRRVEDPMVALQSGPENRESQAVERVAGLAEVCSSAAWLGEVEWRRIVPIGILMERFRRVDGLMVALQSALENREPDAVGRVAVQDEACSLAGWLGGVKPSGIVAGGALRSCVACQHGGEMDDGRLGVSCRAGEIMSRWEGEQVEVSRLRRQWDRMIVGDILDWSCDVRCEVVWLVSMAGRWMTAVWEFHAGQGERTIVRETLRKWFSFHSPVGKAENRRLDVRLESWREWYSTQLRREAILS